MSNAINVMKGWGIYLDLPRLSPLTSLLPPIYTRSIVLLWTTIEYDKMTSIVQHVHISIVG